MEACEKSYECVRGLDCGLRVWCSLSPTLQDEDVVRKSITGSASQGTFAMEDFHNVMSGRKGIGAGSSLAQPSFKTRAIGFQDGAGGDVLSQALALDSLESPAVALPPGFAAGASMPVGVSHLASALHFYILLPLGLLIIGLC